MDIVMQPCRTKGISVIDDFAHNPDKVRASVSALRDYKGRLLIMFQPHGFSPMRMMGKEIIESFASLMNMLDPTAIADDKNYGPEDIDGLCIRRFKKDVQDQVVGSFKERKITIEKCKACLILLCRLLFCILHCASRVRISIIIK